MNSPVSTFRTTVGFGLGTIAVAGLVIAAALLVQRTPGRVFDGDDAVVGDVPHLPPAAIRKG